MKDLESSVSFPRAFKALHPEGLWVSIDLGFFKGGV